MENQKEFYDIYDLSEAIYVNIRVVEWEDSFGIAKQLYNAGFRKQVWYKASAKLPETSVLSVKRLIA